MGYGFIDSASIMGAVGALTTYNTRQEWGEWAGQSVAEVTTAFVLHDGFRIAPGPSKLTQLEPRIGVSKLYQGYDQACKLLADIVKDVPVQDVSTAEIRESGQDIFKDWLLNNVNNARRAITETKQERGYPHWEQWSIENAWVDHSRRLNGLFNAEIINELALVLKVESNDLRTLWEKTTDLRQVKSWSQGKNLDSNFELVRDAFLAAAILRGRYHDYIANQMKWHYMHHPVRQHILVPATEGTEYRIPEATNNLMNIIINGAMEERKPEERVACWVENLRRARLVYHQGLIRQIDDPQLEGVKAEDTAINIAKKLDLRVYPHSLEKQLDWGIVSGTTVVATVLGSLVNFPWGTLAGAVVSLGVGISGISKPLGRRATQALKLTRGNLRELATSEPGRIVRIWGRHK